MESCIRKSRSPAFQARTRCRVRQRSSGFLSVSVSLEEARIEYGRTMLVKAAEILDSYTIKPRWTGRCADAPTQAGSKWPVHGLRALRELCRGLHLRAVCSRK